ncbi:hypothetical protein EX895_004264 [Sporisorium graminicola]|uniref:Uncharacterized protein n=1 Tax=Sporisorium graminicola TaxID=280036 RepID=A0A4U7KQ61_9BASI|nr:hypothetical protein EX895_004264 [Sporisorium graminicola]TKY86625.1 hypothetical protein EX895_004264 [Sporisorium graminicola]
MVSLPKPSALTSSASIDILPRAHLPSPLPPFSTPSCCYQFGLTTLPQEADASLDTDVASILSRLLTLSQLLAIPTLFGRGDGQAWTHSEQHYPALLQWKEQQVPALLAHVEQLLGKLSESSTSGLPQPGSQIVELVLGHVVCAVARYISPGSVGVDSESSSSHKVTLEDGWTSSVCDTKARNALAALRSGSTSTHLPASSTIAKALLTDYIKPIFRETAASSSASTSSVDPTTGRLKPPASGSLFISHLDANLGQHRFSSAGEDSDASNLAPQRFALLVSPETLRTSATQGVEEAGVQSVGERNEALGCVNVLSWCVDALRLEGEADWSEVWPLVVPPLLTLLEHPQPRWRLRGSVIAHRLLLKPSRPVKAEDANATEGRRHEVLGNMLVRTGIGSLLERALHVNLTYIHDEQYAPGLLEQSIGALRQLVLLTTHPISYRVVGQTPPPDAAWSSLDDSEDDCGKRRMDALFRLVSEAILSTWSYLPLPPHGTRLGRELVNVTCSAYLILADDLAPPPQTPHTRVTILGGVARFLDVSLDWIFRSWLSTVAFDHTDQIASSIVVLSLANRLLFGSRDSDVRPDNEPWGPRRFTSLILSSVAKCWISALESHLRGSTQAALGWDELEHGLSTLLRRLSQMDASVESRWSELVRLDQRLEGLLPPA